MGAGEDRVSGLIEYENVPPTVATAFSSGRASMTELTTTLGLEDLYDILEVLAVDARNARTVEKDRARRRRENERRA